MARCDNCKSLILIGGVRESGYRFCGKKCCDEVYAKVLATKISEKAVRERVDSIFSGVCPQCNEQNGPVDIHNTHSIWSFVLISSWSTKPNISCRSCGVKNQSFSILQCLLLGWWGFPWGFLMTPVQIFKNIGGLFHGANIVGPSDELEDLVRMELASIEIQRSSE